jgi:signal transduction histidine kinase
MDNAKIVLSEQRTAVIRSTDAELTPAEQQHFEEMGMGTQVLLPLVVKTKTLGLVQLYDPDPARAYSARDMGLAYALANQAAVALENAHLVRDLQQALEQQKAMQGQLVRAARFSALGELTAVIAHQINNPLTTILGDAEMLVQDTDPDSPFHDSAVAIQRAGERAKRVVERLLGMARSESDFKPHDINHTIREAVALVEAQIRQGNIALTLDLQRDLQPVRAIPGHLEDVWMNLIINARDAITVSRTENGQGSITVKSWAAEDGASAMVQLSDTGSGISPADLERIFDPMFTTKPHGKGTGLGLYICNQIVTEHGGNIEVTSALGEGTQITVRLPFDLQPLSGKTQWQTY